MAHIYPSLISADLLNLETEIKQLDAHCAGYHLDVMDAHFVPNLTFGPAFINTITKKTTKKIWVHLMVDNPTWWLDKMTLPAKSIVTFHIETKNDIDRLINKIKEKNWQPSIAISPKSAPEKTFPFLQLASHLLVMSVEPGFSGQQFMPSALGTFQAIQDYCSQNNIKITLAADGGINKNNIAQLAQLGVQDFAVASAVFESADPVQALEELQKLVTK